MGSSPDRSTEAVSPGDRRFTTSLARLCRRAVPNLLISAVGPAVCFIEGRHLWGLVGGVVLALAWNGVAQAGRILRGQPWSGILLVGLIGLVMRGSLALALHSARMYFVAPAVVTAITGAAYVMSVFTPMPLVTRMFAELVPPSVVDPGHPRWRRILRRGTVFYGMEQIGVSVLSLFMVVRMSPSMYAAVHPVISSAVFALAAAAALPFLWPGRRAGQGRRPAAGVAA